MKKEYFLSTLHERRLLSASTSPKKTYHLVLTFDPLTDPSRQQSLYSPGDSLAILPTNDLLLVDQLLDQLPTPNEHARTFLMKDANLTKPHPHLIAACRSLCSDPEKRSPLELVSIYRDIDLSQLSSFFLPLLPRLYSIASSQKMHPNEAHLLVTLVTFNTDESSRYGVASSFLTLRAQVGKTDIPCFIQAPRHFRLPEDPKTDILFICAGTGIAPFRAFMQERLLTQSGGKNWLFFGERHRNSDFYYEDFFSNLVHEKRLRMDLAFSRDGAEKMYVQHCLWNQKKEVWAYIEEGATLYICGNAHGMARDVERTLLSIITTEGSLTEEKAKDYLKKMKSQKRYLLDVY